MIPHRGGLPHSDTSGSKPARGSPKIFAACHVLLRLLVPRHPPDALLILIKQPTPEIAQIPIRDANPQQRPKPHQASTRPPPQLAPQQDDPTRHAQEPSTPPKTRTRTGPPIPRQKPITQHIRTQNAPERCTRTKHMTPQAAPAPNPAAQSPESSTAQPRTHGIRPDRPCPARHGPPATPAQHHHAKPHGTTTPTPELSRASRDAPEPDSQ